MEILFQQPLRPSLLLYGIKFLHVFQRPCAAVDCTDSERIFYFTRGYVVNVSQLFQKNQSRFNHRSVLKCTRQTWRHYTLIADWLKSVSSWIFSSTRDSSKKLLKVFHWLKYFQLWFSPGCTNEINLTEFHLLHGLSVSVCTMKKAAAVAASASTTVDYYAVRSLAHSQFTNHSTQNYAPIHARTCTETC